MHRSVPTLRFIEPSFPSGPRVKANHRGQDQYPFPRRRIACSLVGPDSVSYWHNHGWRQVELADAPSKTKVIKGGNGLAIAATGVMKGISEIES